jgi:hypothetical protein
VRHAGPAALDALEPLLADLRGVVGLVEKGRGVFYRRGRAFLHFHEDPKGLFADIRNEDGGDFDRIEVTAAETWPELLALARRRAA